MRMAPLILPLFSLLALLLSHPSSAISWRLRYYRGLLMLGKNQCYNRCRVKHGFFRDSAGEIKPASVAKRYFIVVPKCQCMVSRELRTFITQRFGPEAAKHYGHLNFIGRTRRAREDLDRLADESVPKTARIKFVTYDEMQRITAQRRAAEVGKPPGAAASHHTNYLPPEITLQKVAEDGTRTQEKLELTAEDTAALNNLMAEIVERKKAAATTSA